MLAVAAAGVRFAGNARVVPNALAVNGPLSLQRIWDGFFFVWRPVTLEVGLCATSDSLPAVVCRGRSAQIRSARCLPLERIVCVADRIGP